RHRAETAPAAAKATTAGSIALCSLGKARPDFGHHLLVLSFLLRRQGSLVIRPFLIRGSPALAARLPGWNRQSGKRTAGGTLRGFVGFRGRCDRSGSLGDSVVGRGDHSVIRRPKTE